MQLRFVVASARIEERKSILHTAPYNCNKVTDNKVSQSVWSVLNFDAAYAQWTKRLIWGNQINICSAKLATDTRSFVTYGFQQQLYFNNRNSIELALNFATLYNLAFFSNIAFLRLKIMGRQ